jgi:hypothetical protein
MAADFTSRSIEIGVRELPDRRLTFKYDVAQPTPAKRG